MTTEGYIPYPPWLEDNPVLREEWERVWTETGNGQLAIDAVRRHADYDTVFAGNRREDGTIRYTEDQYLNIIESYDDVLLSVDVNPALFQGLYIDLLEGLTSPNEFATRVNSVYENVIQRTEGVRQFYADEYGIDLTNSAIIASALDPGIGAEILGRRIAISEVGGSAFDRGFTIGADYAERLVQFGVDTAGEAQALFGEAQEIIPTIRVLQARHADPEDEFDLEDFTAAAVFNDPDQRRQMRRLMAQERSSFGADRSLTVRQDEPGALTGLAER